MAYDPGLHRIYVAGKSGVVSVIQQRAGDVYETVDTIHVHYGAHTLAVDPRSHSVYVAYASLIGRPRIAVFDARP